MAAIPGTFNHFGKIALELHNATAPMIAETAQFIAETYQASAPRRTGFMAGSAYYRTVSANTYGGGGIAPPGDSYLLPEVEGPASDQEAVAAVAANYAGFVELGTRFMGAEPSFYPAVDLAAGEFEAKGAEFESRIAALV